MKLCIVCGKKAMYHCTWSDTSPILKQVNVFEDYFCKDHVPSAFDHVYINIARLEPVNLEDIMAELGLIAKD